MKLAFTGGNATGERSVKARLIDRNGAVSPSEANAIVVIGGNGSVISALHRYHRLQCPMFSLSIQHEEFLTNRFRPGELTDRIKSACPQTVFPLHAEWTAADGRQGDLIAFNEVALFRESREMIAIEVSIERQVRLDRLIGDGVLVATPVGSTAYNFSAHGPVLPIGSPLIALTPIAPSRPRRWRGALLPDRMEVRFRVVRPDRGSALLTADFNQVSDVIEVTVRVDRDRPVTLLFDSERSLSERVLREQFGGWSFGDHSDE